MGEADARPARKRARQACTSCNARRVRCNVTDQRPCQNCVIGGTACETRESRRGKHPRPAKRQKSEETAGASTGAQHHDDEVAVSYVLASLHKNANSHVFDGAFGQANEVNSEGNGLQASLSLQEDPLKEDEGAVFLGESSSLRYVHEEVDGGKNQQSKPQASGRMRHSVPSTVKAEALMPQWEAERRRARIELLKNEGAFSLPPQNVLMELLATYFSVFHPCFAIVSEPDFWAQLEAGTLSPLLLQAMLFVGVIHCDESVLAALGLENRHKAKYIFYNRVKDIYDADFERKQVVVVQALFLMSFWRAGALFEKDARHWLGAAITLAETKALHRSSGSDDAKAVGLRKRLWWSLYTRERQCAAALGLPNRVRDEDCDIETLERSDFTDAFAASVEPAVVRRYISYAIGMADLAQLLGKIVLGEYLPNKSLSSKQRALMRDDLQRWKQRLPLEMQCDNDIDQSGFYTNMLHLAYNNLLILLYRPSFLSSNADGHDAGGSVALQAAARNSTIVENMLAEGNLRHGQIHVITNLFNTLCIHTVHMRRSEGTARTVAEHRAKLCLLGLRELQRTWEVKNWLLKLFFQYLDYSTAARLRVERDDDSGLPSAALTSTRVSEEPAALDPDGCAVTSAPLYPLPVPCDTTAPNNLPISAFSGVVSWPWTEETNQFLFSQIENEFAFGEGGTFDWSPTNSAFNEMAFSLPLT